MHTIKSKVLIVFIVCFVSSQVLVSCKSKAAVLTATAVEPETSSLKAKNIIEKHYNIKSNFSTLYIKANARFSDEKQAQNVNAEIKIKKDEQILISIRFLGITMAKASITPSSVSYYEKVKGSYFEGDFSLLSQWLGTDLDYNKIQNMLLGEAIDDLTKGKYTESLVEKLYRLDDLKEENTKKTFYIDSDDFSVKKQEITQTTAGRMFQVAYSKTKVFNEATLPLGVNINTYQPKGKTQIDLDYDTVSFNEELSFPYSVPNGYKRIIIK